MFLFCIFSKDQITNASPVGFHQNSYINSQSRDSCDFLSNGEDPRPSKCVQHVFIYAVFERDISLVQFDPKARPTPIQNPNKRTCCHGQLVC